MTAVPPFDRRFFASGQAWSRIGSGGLGGKAEGLLRIGTLLQDRFGGSVGEIRVSIPASVIVGTDVFHAFVEWNRLKDLAGSDEPDDRVAHAFLQGELPEEVLDDLRGLVEGVHSPLAIRSSSLLEDTLAHPFAGVYETKMIPNNQPTPEERYQRLVEAVKLVFASTYFACARDYRRAIGVEDRREGMAVMIQRVVGRRFGDRFYPHVSVVGRSFNYYPIHPAAPGDGVVSLALGLGKTIVDGGRCWSYSPRHPQAPPPFASTRERMQGTQTRFWAVNMARPEALDPLVGTEYLVQGTLADAERDRTLDLLASTYDADSDRMRPGTARDGPKVLDFQPILAGQQPLNEAVLEIMDLCEEALGCDAEIELALSLPGPGDSPEAEGGQNGVARMGVVQVRPMSAPREEVEIDPDELRGEGVLLASRQAMGNGRLEGIRDVIYVRPDAFEMTATRSIAGDIDAWNRALMAESRPYLLIGFGRWGSSDPWLGVPVQWSQVAGARILVEATLPSVRIEPSQGTHFFHNLTSLGAAWMAVGPGAPSPVDWEWLDGLGAVAETERLRHVRLPGALDVRVDGRSSTGLIRKGPGRPGA
ncbi:MAG: PEP/pyruvate-binding domain-containing protein [Gemmatimonadota bacterium]